jgi:NAD(P)-dependent dehydrogenase (short-subunit alcohol dehydrogenase family)
MNIKRKILWISDFMTKVAIVTGAGSQVGYGKGITLTLSKERGHVVCDVGEAISGSALVIDSSFKSLPLNLCSSERRQKG